DLNIDPKALTQLAGGVEVTGDFGSKLSFWMRFHNNSLNGVNPYGVRYPLSITRGISRESPDRENPKITYYNIGETAIKGEIKGVRIMTGIFSESWGPGFRGDLMISDKAPAYPHTRYSVAIGKKLEFTYLWGSLFSGVVDSLRSRLDPGLSSTEKRTVYIQKKVAAHRLDWYPAHWLRLSFAELIIFSGRSFESLYAFPLVPFWSAQRYLGDIDNLQMAGEIEILALKTWRFYGSLVVDEINTFKIFDKDNNRNWIALQGGLAHTGEVFGRVPFILRGEYTFVDPRAYMHRWEETTPSSYDYPLGFWSGANSDNIYVGIQFLDEVFGQLHLYYEHTRKGEYGGQFIEAQYDRSEVIPFLETFDGSPHAQRTVWGMELIKRLPWGFWLDLSLLELNHQYIFDEPGDARYANSMKLDVNIALRYNYEF
ncbi:hypothetical protein ACFL6E_07150, partial [Candidatus Neomarinimicrobiota bacterium]